MTLNLQRIVPVEEAACPVESIYFVLQRANGSWTPGAKIISVFATEQVAEVFAAEQKKKHPQQVFGVASLRSEAREVENPIQIVRTTGEN